MTASRAVDRLDPLVWRLASVTVIGSIMVALDSTIVYVALQRLSEELHSPIADVQWVASGYLLAAAAAVPLGGWLARRFGETRVYLACLMLFAAGSALSVISWSVVSLVMFRMVQGVGGGLLLPVGQMIVAAVAGPKNMGRVWSVITVPIVITPVFGPALGGLLLDQLGWRWIFLVNIPFCVVALVLGLRVLPRTAPVSAGRLDVRGFVLLVGGLPLFMYGLVTAGRSSIGLEAGAVVGGGVLLTLFGAHARRRPAPLLDVRLFADRAFANSALVSLTAGAALYGAMLLMPLYFQSIRGADATMAGVMLAPQAIGTAVVTPFLGRLTMRFGGGLLVVVGLVLTIGGTVPLTFLDEATPYALIGPALFVRGIGFGLVLLPAMIAAFATLRPEQLSDGTPQVSVVQRVGASLGTAVFAVLLAHYLKGIPASGARHLHDLAGAYATACWWAVGLSAGALGPACLLVRAERTRRREERCEASG